MNLRQVRVDGVGPGELDAAQSAAVVPGRLVDLGAPPRRLVRHSGEVVVSVVVAARAAVLGHTRVDEGRGAGGFGVRGGRLRLFGEVAVHHRHATSLSRGFVTAAPSVAAAEALRNTMTTEGNGAPVLASPNRSRPRRKRTSPRSAHSCHHAVSVRAGTKQTTSSAFACTDSHAFAIHRPMSRP